MRLWGISDLHLAGGSGKTMDRFGPEWVGHAARIESAWRASVRDGDVVIVPGDLSWAMRLAEAASDLAWLAALPGRKVLVRGNHDYWWTTGAKLRAALPEGVYALRNDSVAIDGVAFAGVRYWTDPELVWPGAAEPETDAAPSLSAPPGAAPGPKAPAPRRDPAEDERLLEREIERLRLSLAALDPAARFRVALLHYPPVDPAGRVGRAIPVLAGAGIELCAFGHIHGYRSTVPPEWTALGVRCTLVSCDALGFAPRLLTEFEG